MKKLVVMMAVLAFAACGSDDTKKNTNTNVNSCSATQNGNSRCTGTIWQTCNGGTWANTKDCATTNQQCRAVAALPTAVECYTPTLPGEEFEKCTTSLPCADGLVCSDIAAIDYKVCLTACTGTECGADRYCETTWMDAQIASTNFCAPTAAVNEFCWSEDTCAGLTDPQCYAVTGIMPECLEGCPVGNLGTTTGCTSGTCLLGNSWIYQGGNPDAPVDCSSVACDVGFDCLTFALDETGTTTADYCVRRDGVCGTPVPNFVQDTAAEVEAWISGSGGSINMAHVCNMPGANAFCSPTVSTATGETSCEGTNYGAIFSDENDNTFECSSDIDCYLVGGECMDFGGTTGQVCAASINLCTVFCEDAEGTPLTGNVCPTGAGLTGVCTQPVFEWSSSVHFLGVGYPIVERDTEGAVVTCVTAGGAGECGADFNCVAFSDGNACARGRKICN